MAPLKKVDTAAALAKAREVLAAINGRMAKLGQDREAALIGDDDGEVFKLDQQIEESERLARTGRDRIRLLEMIARKEEAERVAKRRAALIERIGAKFAERDREAVELQKDLTSADARFRKMIELANECAAAWPWEQSQIHAAGLSPATIKTLVSYELFRVGARPFLGGRPGEVAQQDFPGGQAPTLHLRGQPEAVKPLGDAMREASAYAGRVMRGEIVAPRPEPPPNVSEKIDPAPQQPPAEAPPPVGTRTAAQIQATIPKQQLKIF